MVVYRGGQTKWLSLRNITWILDDREKWILQKGVIIFDKGIFCHHTQSPKDINLNLGKSEFMHDRVAVRRVKRYF